MNIQYIYIYYTNVPKIRHEISVKMFSVTIFRMPAGNVMVYSAAIGACEEGRQWQQARGRGSPNTVVGGEEWGILW